MRVGLPEPGIEFLFRVRGQTKIVVSFWAPLLLSFFLAHVFGIRKLIISAIVLKASSCSESSRNDRSIAGCAFEDMYEDGVAPPWPDAFKDRLFVIKFNFVKNQTTGNAILGTDNGFNYPF